MRKDSRLYFAIMKKLFILLLISCIACTQKENAEEKVQKKTRIEHLKNKAIHEGDDFAYGSYLEFAQNSGIKHEQLSVSLIMNHKFDNERSYYQVFKYMVELDNNFKYDTKNLAKLETSDRAFAMSYLIKGAKKNNIDCQVKLEKIYRNGYGGEINLKKSDSLYSLLEKRAGIGHFYLRHRQDKSKVDEIGN